MSQLISKKRASYSQLEFLVSRLEEMPSMTGCRPQGKTECKQFEDAWSSLAATLNAMMFGTIKPVEKWLQAWRDLKGNIKRKAFLFKTEPIRNRAIPLTPLEKRVLAIVYGVESGSGDLKNEIIKKGSETMRTEGEPSGAVFLTPLEEKVLAIVGSETASESDDVESIPVNIEMELDEMEEISQVSPDVVGEADVTRVVSWPRKIIITTEAASFSVNRKELSIEKNSLLLEEESRAAKEAREDRLLDLEERRLDLEERRLDLEEKREAREERRLDLEDRREARKERQLDLEDRKEAREERRLDLEERRELREERRLDLENRRDEREEMRLDMEKKREEKPLNLEDRRKERRLDLEKRWLDLEDRREAREAARPEK